MAGVVYLIEDDSSLATAIEISLAAEKFRVHVYGSVAAARAALALERPDLVVLDLSLPDGDGLDILRALRRSGAETPVLILTARGTIESRLEGFRRGADDYLVKPFDLEELLARVRALLRRAARVDEVKRLKIGLLELDFGARRARHRGQDVELTEIEWRFLRYMAERSDAPVSRQVLLESIWGMGPGCQSRTIDTFASRLRKWIEPDPARPRYLVTVRGLGYRLRLRPASPAAALE